MRVIIAGSRNITHPYFLENAIKGFVFKHTGYDDIEHIRQVIQQIVSGTARGVDSLGEEFGEAVGINIKQFPADWDKYGKRAGYIRNEEMAKYADAAIILWDGKSKGTKHMIQLAYKHNLDVHLVMMKYDRRNNEQD